MTKKKVYISIFSLFLLFSLISFSSAWIVPDTHDWIAKEALSQAPNSWGGQIVSEHWDDFSACQSLTDYSVFFYFQQGFSTIGKVYLASHNLNICKRGMELADKNNPAEIACAIGICSMEFEDEPSHNDYVPMMIRRTGLVNGIIHAPVEECINKKITTPELHTQGISALVNKYPVHKDYLIRVFQSDNRATTINVGVMMDEFVGQVANNKQYTVGFRGFTAVPTSIHIILILWFLFGMIGLTYLIRKKEKSIINKISIVLLLILFVLPVILLYVLYFTGNIWRAFQWITTPICPLLPLDGWEQHIQKAVSNEVNLFNNGADAVFQLRDPAGQQALHDADAGNVWKLWVIGLVLLSFIGLFFWLNIRKRKK